MTKFSVIIPAYNVEKYIKRCLDSVFNQTFKDYEVILVDDGSDDKTKEIAKEYNLKMVCINHNGVSESRNVGIKEARGEYLIFLDSDDYLEENLLETINDNLEEDLDLLRYQARNVYDNREAVDFNEISFEKTTGKEAFDRIIKYHYIESIWCYAVRRKYWISNNYNFKKETVHEDFGLFPLVIINAKSVKSISYIGYNYYRRSGSIMNTVSYDWTKTKVRDFYNHYLNLIKEIDKTKIDSKNFKSFVANSTIIKICELKGKDYKKYKKKLKKDKVFDNLLDDSFKRKVKKSLFKISPKLTIKLLK